MPKHTMPNAYIFDVDGTLAHIDVTKPRDIYDASRAHEDLLDDSVYEVLRCLWDCGNNIIIMSGRTEDHKAETENWLALHLIPYDHLYMRGSGDMRKDSIVKQELFYKHVDPHYNVRGVFDDRNQVVNMWREIGLKCFQVQEGDF